MIIINHLSQCFFLFLQSKKPLWVQVPKREAGIVKGVGMMEEERIPSALCTEWRSKSSLETDPESTLGFREKLGETLRNQ